MDEDKSDSNSSDENKWGAWLFSVGMTHHIQTQSIIQSRFKQMGEKTAATFNWSHMRYQAHLKLYEYFSPFSFLQVNLEGLFATRTQTLTWLSCISCLLSDCESTAWFRFCAVKQSALGHKTVRQLLKWLCATDLDFYDSRGFYKNTQHNPDIPLTSGGKK